MTLGEQEVYFGERILSAEPAHPPVHDDHQRHQHQQKGGQQGNGDAVCQNAEQRRDQAGAGVGTGHLRTDDGLRPVRTKICRNGVHDAGIEGRASQAADQQTCQRDRGVQRQQHGQDAGGDQCLAQMHHLPIVEIGGDHAARGPAKGDAQIKQTGEAGSGLRFHAPVQRQIAAGPKTGGAFHGTGA